MAELTENLIRLKSVSGVGNVTAWRLIQRFGGASGVLGASVSQLTEVKGVTPALAKSILQSEKMDPRHEMERAVAAGITILPYDDDAYPRPLLYSYDPPVLLYVRGRLVKNDNVAVGIVGTRAASSYGRNTALEMAEILARGGYTIVSGLALGVDTFAHIGAMNAGGRTVGVLGCGFDHMYPEQNRDLALEMSRSGAVVSEFPMGTRPSRETFPMRNRIIAGMSMGILVIEAPLRSGALITARLANEIGRTVFAIPGRVGDVRSEGCNKLIRDGAVMVTSADDIIHELNPSLEILPPPPKPSRRKSAEAKEPGPEPQASGKRSGGKTDRTPRGTEKPPADPYKPAPPASKGEQPEEAALELAKPNPELSPDDRTILATLSREWKNIDDIIGACGLPAGRVTACLALLRMKRVVEQNAGQLYRLR